MRAAILLSTVLFSAPVAAFDARRDAYHQLFVDSTYATLTTVLGEKPVYKAMSAEERERRLRKQAVLFGDCHMQAFDAYDPVIQSAAFDAVSAGKSFPEVKHALNTAIAIEGASGGTREERVKESLRRAMSIGTECMQAVNGKND